jgi:hypothetical protein
MHACEPICLVHCSGYGPRVHASPYPFTLQLPSFPPEASSLPSEPHCWYLAWGGHLRNFVQFVSKIFSVCGHLPIRQSVNYMVCPIKLLVFLDWGMWALPQVERPCTELHKGCFVSFGPPCVCSFNFSVAKILFAQESACLVLYPVSLYTRIYIQHIHILFPASMYSVVCMPPSHLIIGWRDLCSLQMGEGGAMYSRFIIHLC